MENLNTQKYKILLRKIKELSKCTEATGWQSQSCRQQFLPVHLQTQNIFFHFPMRLCFVCLFLRVDKLKTIDRKRLNALVFYRCGETP